MKAIYTGDTKICAMCKIEKPKKDFHKNKKACGVQSKCKTCTSKYKKERYWRNHEVELAKMTKSRLKPENVLQRKGYYEKNKSEYNKRYKTYIADKTKREAIRQRAKTYNIEAYDKISKRAAAYQQRVEVKERRKKIHEQRKKTDLQYLIKRRLRFRLRHIIKALGNDKYKWMSSVDLLGCDMEFFKIYIECKFTQGMSWDRLSEIHIDHIKPCKKFDLTKLEEQKKCFHYTNLQPLWEIDNLKKNAKYKEVF